MVWSGRWQRARGQATGLFTGRIPRGTLPRSREGLIPGNGSATNPRKTALMGDHAENTVKVGLIGWRGMVGSVLMERMRVCGDFKQLKPTFFSTSDVGGQGPTVDGTTHTLENAHDIDALRELPVIISCQGGDYTKAVYPKLRAAGFKGYWIDAASALRMQDDAVLLLDPVNRQVIEEGLNRGIKTFCGANCTVSLMLMALQGLFQAGLVEWLSSMTYQAASGAGAAQMRELVGQMAVIASGAGPVLQDPASSALDVDAAVARQLGTDGFPKSALGAPLAASLIPWIDVPVAGGQTREEWKGFAETNKILGTSAPIPVDGICVRVGSMRCHAQAFTIKLRSDVPLDEVNGLLGEANDWVRVVHNDRDSTVSQLSPAAVSGTLDIPIGRVHKLNMGPEYLGAFSVGDQLLWGAAEPLRRMLDILKHA